MEAYKDVICATHTSRSSRGLHHASPSKLTKRELEDLYYNVVQQNFELKKAVNSQKESMKLMTTRLMRYNNMLKRNPTGPQTCCSASKSIIEDQKHMIESLTLENQKLLEKLRVMTMRLCSKKQFLRTTPPTRSHSRNNATNSLRGSSVKLNDSNETKTSPKVSFEQPHRLDSGEAELFKKKIEELQFKLRDSDMISARRVADLETELNQVRSSISGLRAEKVALASSCHERFEEVKRLHSELRASQHSNHMLSAELTIERSKTKELENRLKCAELSREVDKLLETKMAEDIVAGSTNDDKENNPKDVNIPCVRLYDDARGIGNFGLLEESLALEADSKPLSEKGLHELNNQLISKLSKLQAEVDLLKVTAQSRIDKPNLSTEPDLIKPELVSTGVQCSKCDLDDLVQEIVETISETSFVLRQSKSVQTSFDMLTTVQHSSNVINGKVKNGDTENVKAKVARSRNQLMSVANKVVNENKTKRLRRNLTRTLLRDEKENIPKNPPKKESAESDRHKKPLTRNRTFIIDSPGPELNGEPYSPRDTPESVRTVIDSYSAVSEPGQICQRDQDDISLSTDISTSLTEDTQKESEGIAPAPREVGAFDHIILRDAGWMRRTGDEDSAGESHSQCLLSEGELEPDDWRLYKNRRKDTAQTVMQHQQSTASKVEEALNAITMEIKKCDVLLKNPRKPDPLPV